MSDDVELPDEMTVGMKPGFGTLEREGSERRDCEVCGDPVVINPATITSIERGVYPDYIICVECANEHADE